MASLYGRLSIASLQQVKNAKNAVISKMKKKKKLKICENQRILIIEVGRTDKFAFSLSFIFSFFLSIWPEKHSGMREDHSKSFLIANFLIDLKVIRHLQ